jgi:hypothetical protein
MALSNGTPNRPNPDFYYASHLPVLRALPRVRSILEAGAGRYSTPVLAAMCDVLRSWDEAEGWAKVLTDEAQGAYIVRWSERNILDTIRDEIAAELPDLFFADSGTARIAKTQDRGRTALLALNAGVRYVVCHDTEIADPCYLWGDVRKAAKYAVEWRGTWYGERQPDGRRVPWTSVFSNVDDLADVRRNLRMA